MGPILVGKEKDYSYFLDLLLEASNILVKNITGFRRTIRSSSMTNTWYVHFRVDLLTERTFYAMCLLIGGYINSLEYYPSDSIEHFLIEEIRDKVLKESKRFKDTKFFEFFVTLLDFPQNLISLESVLPSQREFSNNYEISLVAVMGRMVSVRQNNPRRVKRREFRRGYADHGSMSDESTRARREANEVRPGRNTGIYLSLTGRKRWHIGLKQLLEYIGRLVETRIRLEGPDPAKVNRNTENKLELDIRRRRKKIRKELLAQNVINPSPDRDYF